MWGNFKLVFNQNLLSSALDYIAMETIKGNREKVLPSQRAGMLLFRVDGANRCSSDKELIGFDQSIIQCIIYLCTQIFSIESLVTKPGWMKNLGDREKKRKQRDFQCSLDRM